MKEGFSLSHPYPSQMKNIDTTLELFIQSLTSVINSPRPLKELFGSLHLIQQNRAMSLVQKTLHLKETISKKLILLQATPPPLRIPLQSFIYAFHAYLLYHHTPDPKHHLKLTLLHYSQKVATDKHLPHILQQAITQIQTELYQQPSAFTIIAGTQAATPHRTLPPAASAHPPRAIAQLAGRKRPQSRQSTDQHDKKNTGSQAHY